MTTQRAVFHTDLRSLELIHRGKVRDIYAIDDAFMLIVASDRLSAFDVVLPDPIPGKGRVLTALSNFWFERTRGIVDNHLSDRTLDEVLPDSSEHAGLTGQAVVVRRLDPLPLEAIVRGYIIGSGWKDYQASGAVCGIPLPPGMRIADRLPTPIYTPSTKADVGEHDQNIRFEDTVELVGEKLARQVRDTSLEVYRQAAEYAESRGIIIADTKLEFGTDEQGRLCLIDELLTPDSSRFWPADSYTPGSNPQSFDKQFVRDYLETLDWDKTPPGPSLPAQIIEKTTEKYLEAQRRLTA